MLDGDGEPTLEDDDVGDAVICPSTLVRVIVAGVTLPVVDNEAGNVAPISVSALNTSNNALRLDSSPSTSVGDFVRDARVTLEWALTRDNITSARREVQRTPDIDYSVRENHIGSQRLIFV